MLHLYFSVCRVKRDPIGNSVHTCCPIVKWHASNWKMITVSSSNSHIHIYLLSLMVCHLRNTKNMNKRIVWGVAYIDVKTNPKCFAWLALYYLFYTVLSRCGCFNKSITETSMLRLCTYVTIDITVYSYVTLLGGIISVFIVLPVPICGAPCETSHRDPQRRGTRGTADPRRLHVQGWGERPVLSAACSSQNCWKPSGNWFILF